VYTFERLTSGGLDGLLSEGEHRGGLWRIGWLLLWQAPWAGWGGGGYLRELHTQAYRLTGAAPEKVDYVGNHYLMIPIDLGIPALVIQLVIVIAALVVGFRALRQLHAPKIRLALTILLVAQLVFLLMIVVAPPYFPDAIYAWTLNLALLFVMAQRVSITSVAGERETAWARNVRLGFLGAFVVLTAIGNYDVTFGSHGYRARLDAEGSPLRYERNCYGIEKQGQRRWSWCGRNARVKLPLPAKGPPEMVVALSAGNPDLQQNPLTVRYGGLSGPTQELILATAGLTQIRIPLDVEHIVELRKPDGKSVERFAVVSLDVSRTWVPKEWGVNEDPRELGVLVELP
jgi:hypothetical protein